jgi:hypothetical protein
VRAPARLLLGVLALVPALALAGCRGDTARGDLEGFALELSLAPTPPLVGPNRVVLRLIDPEGAPVEEAEVRLEGTMTHAGMVPVDATATPTGDGRFQVQAFAFTMAGDWVLRAHVRLPDGRAGVLERPVRVVAGPDPAPS